MTLVDFSATSPSVTPMVMTLRGGLMLVTMVTVDSLVSGMAAWVTTVADAVMTSSVPPPPSPPPPLPPPTKEACADGTRGERSGTHTG